MKYISKDRAASVLSADNTHCLETPVEYNITDTACSTKKLVFFISNLPILLRAPGKHPSRKLSTFGHPPPSPRKGSSAVRGGGWIFSETTHLRFDKVLVSKSEQKHFDIHKYIPYI